MLVVISSTGCAQVPLCQYNLIVSLIHVDSRWSTQSGSSTATTYQGYCETGLLGYFQWLPNGYPRVGTNNRVQYVCNADWENAVTAAELI